MKFQTILTTIVILGFSVLASAEDIYPCDSSCSGLFSEASRLASDLPEGTEFSLIDTQTFESGTYVVEYYYSRAAGEYLERAKSITKTSNVINAANELKAAAEELEKVNVEVPETIAENAHSAIVSTQTAGNVSSYVSSNLGVWDTVGALGSVVLSIFNKITDVKGVVVVAFPDGSTAQYQIEGLTYDEDGNLVFEFKLVEGSAQDADGNNIPTTETEIVGERRFTSESNSDNFNSVVDYYGVNHHSGSCRSILTSVCTSGANGLSCTTYTTCF